MLSCMKDYVKYSTSQNGLKSREKMEMISDIYTMTRQHLTEFYGLLLEGTIVALILLEIILALAKIV